MSKRNFISALLFSAALSGAFAQVAANPEANAQPVETLSIIGVGDIMMGLNYPEDNPSLPVKDGADIFADVKSILKDADITTGNLEGVLANQGNHTKRCSDPKVCFVFRMPERYVDHLVDAGFDFMALANNHSSDFGVPGRESTQRVLKEAGIGFAGFENVCESQVIERNGVKYGFASFSVNNGTLQVTEYDKATQVISDLKKNADIVIVAMHIGAEGVKYNHITRGTETYVGEDRGNPYKFARTVIDAGADVVFGHGPHVVRAVDVYKGKFIAYSLGNFATPTGISTNGLKGYAPIVKVIVDKKTGYFVEGKIYSNLQKGAEGVRHPLRDKTNACIKEIKSLTETDIPEAPIKIEKDGSIKLK